MIPLMRLHDKAYVENYVFDEVLGIRVPRAELFLFFENAKFNIGL